MTPDRVPGCGVVCPARSLNRAISLRYAVQFCCLAHSGCARRSEAGRMDLAEVPLHRPRGRTRIHRALLGGRYSGQPRGLALSLGNVRHQYDGLHHHRLFHDLPEPPRQPESGMAFPRPHRLHRLPTVPFSTYEWETLSNLRAGAFLIASTYAVGSLILGLVAVWCGSLLAELI